MIKRKSQFNDLERDRFSNFVIDLSHLETNSRGNSSEPKAKLFKKLIFLFNNLKNSVTERTIILFKNRKKKKTSFFHWGEHNLNFKLSLNFLNKNGFKLFDRKSIKKVFAKHRRRKQNWYKLIRDKEKIFYAQPRLAQIKSRLLTQSLKDKRLEEAESTALWYRSLLTFTLVLILIILPFKLLSYFQLINVKNLENKIVNHSKLALNNLLAASNLVTQQDFKRASSQFKQAGINFLAAEDEVSKINDVILVLASLSNNKKIKLASESKEILAAGFNVSSLGQDLILATDSLFDNQQKDFSVRLDKFLIYGHRAINDAHNLKDTIIKINVNNLPIDYRSQFISLRKQVVSVTDNLSSFVDLGDKLKKILGLSRDRRYLLVFQNNSELRASGGFIGSYALLDLHNATISNLEVPGGGSYDTEAGLNVRVAAPQPLWLVNTRWYFWDANWWPDWPTTAKNLMWFYEHSNGPSVDGVIGLTPTVVEKLLRITGPIDLSKEYGLIIDADNFRETVQLISERQNLIKTNPQVVSNIPATSSLVISNIPLKQDLSNNINHKPKKIIGDLLAKILEVLPSKLNQNNLVKILTIFEESMSEKQILFYFTDPNFETEVSKHNWAGEVRNTNKDYLLVVNTNIAGQKTDPLIKEHIKQDIKVETNGAIIDTLEITRIHHGIKHQVLNGVRNVDWLRVYVPAGSKLLSASGFKSPDAKYLQNKPDSTFINSPLLANEEAAQVEPLSGTKIYLEDNKTVFANWSVLDPGETATIVLKYKLPFNFFAKHSDGNWLRRINDLLNPQAKNLWPYSLLVQKQPGAKASDFESTLFLSDSLSVFWHYPDYLSEKHGWKIVDKLDADKYWSILVKKNK